MPRTIKHKGRVFARPQGEPRFDHGQPISKIDTRPIAFVFAFLVTILAISHYTGRPMVPDADLPDIHASPIYNLDERFVVTLKRPESKARSSDSSRTPFLATAECQTILGNGQSVSGEELYDYGFRLLDQGAHSSTLPAPSPLQDPKHKFQRPIPRFFIRADRDAPWSCVGGAVYNLKRAGYPTIGFMTAPST